MSRMLWSLTLLMLVPVLVSADEKKEPKPGELPVTAKLVAKTTTYQLDLGGLNAAAYQKLLADSVKTGKTPPPPAVEMALEVTNTSDKPVRIWFGGDSVILNLSLMGPGAVQIMPLRAMTREFRIPKTITLEPGKSYSVPIRSLAYGLRNMTAQAYWTEPGDYTLGATLSTGISPAPKDSKDVGDGFGSVVLTAAPIALKIEAK